MISFVLIFMLTSAFVTFAYTETSCVDARPMLLLIILVVGLVIGFLLNLPFFAKCCKALCRYCRRLKDGEPELPRNCTISDATITLLMPPGDEEAVDDSETKSLVDQTQSVSSSGRSTKHCRPQVARSAAPTTRVQPARVVQTNVLPTTATKRAPTIYKNVLVRTRKGILVLANDGMTFTSTDDDEGRDDKLIVQYTWTDDLKVDFSKKTKPKKMMRVIDDSSKNEDNGKPKRSVFIFPSQEELERLRDDVRERHNTTKDNNDALEASFSQTLSEQLGMPQLS